MSLNVANCIPDVWFRLGFRSQADMEAASSWVTDAELYQWADDAVKGIARSTLLFLSYDQSTVLLPATAQYPLPAATVLTEGAWALYSAPPSVQLLRLTSQAQLTALDATWSFTTGVPLRMSLDAGDIHTATLYPVPGVGGNLALVIELAPADVTAGSAVIPCTGILQDAVSYSMIAGALSKESDYARREVAKHCQERMGLYLAIVKRLWGDA
jgi:hypothetical protein